MRLLVTITLITSAQWSTLASAQGGGMGFVVSSPMQVVIMLGDDYDYQSKPFTNANELVDAFTSGTQANGMFVVGIPKLESVRVDVKTPLPKSGQRSVVA